ncbi:hypothetical protein [Fimbriimonas ginsengisoli]|uniref:Uncharacterized protein n=1 Tax=Fimbriimonas ginsengisoli Gsoil 348 TaxID=661478 RepID=A0A068NU25_FIMGI|nr:hypothetical protein [Fimbriimonas ginsengisoli]AIE87028.1 hypothetical protein OP10G_3660 [Fimbriimonas ginsengisoli Gsoil 348]
MTLRKSALAVGLLLVVVTPFLPPGYAEAVQVLAAIALIFHLVVIGIARIPTPRIIAGLRILCALAAVLFAAMAMNPPLANDRERIYLGCRALGLAIIAVGPWIPKGPRIWLYYGAILVWVASGLDTAILAGKGTLMEYATLVIYPLILIHGISNWANTGVSFVSRELEVTKRKARKLLKRLDENVSFGEVPQREKLVVALRALAGASLSEQERYDRLLQLCAENSKSALAWRLAFAAAWHRNDHNRVRQLTLELEKADMATEIGLSSNVNDLRAQLQTADERTETWLREDKLFAELHGA